jgi:hypothetical protein
MSTRLTGEDEQRALAVRNQLQLYETELALVQARAELTVLKRQQLQQQLPQLEARWLQQLQAPEGAKFDWQTFGYTNSDGSGGGSR